MIFDGFDDLDYLEVGTEVSLSAKYNQKAPKEAVTAEGKAIAVFLGQNRMHIGWISNDMTIRAKRLSIAEDLMRRVMSGGLTGRVVGYQDYPISFYNPFNSIEDDRKIVTGAIVELTVTNEA